ncbi:MAG: YigZ family protein [Treponemataceae bacterium]|nr:YigZ family protein [Treponemataceae bacterium]
MLVLKEYAINETEVKKSRFIAEIFPVISQSQARELLKAQKQTYFDARHVVHAFVIGKSGEVLGCSDDGEPGGTAGRPVLDVLKGSGITNCMITVTRYFGGILLGTGGLVKAYGDAAKEVLKKAQTEELVEKEFFTIAVPYDLYDQVRNLYRSYSASDISESFETLISINGSIEKSKFNDFAEQLKNLSNGKIDLNKEEV